LVGPVGQVYNWRLNVRDAYPEVLVDRLSSILVCILPAVEFVPPTL